MTKMCAENHRKIVSGRLCGNTCYPVSGMR